MAYLSLVLVFLACFAGNVVELEPVKALSYNCDRLTTSGMTGCQGSPFCYWNSTGTARCVDDPCLKQSNRVLEGLTDQCQNAGDDQCIKETYAPAADGHDCTSATPNTGILCVSNQYTKTFDYCAYAYVRDQKCPDSICRLDTTSGSTIPGCVKETRTNCQMLSEKDCALVPKCYWRSTQCEQDPCFDGSADQDCKLWTGTGVPTPLDTVAAGDCVDFKPLKRGTTSIQLYCVYKNNKTPNVCYFAGKNASTSTTDYGETYPTYDYTPTSQPECTGTLTGCEGTGDCYTTANSGGALAGLYCTDGTHGNASILRIPSILVFLVVSALSLFIL